MADRIGSPGPAILADRRLHRRSCLSVGPPQANPVLRGQRSGALGGLYDSHAAARRAHVFVPPPKLCRAVQTNAVHLFQTLRCGSARCMPGRGRGREKLADLRLPRRRPATQACAVLWCCAFAIEHGAGDSLGGITGARACAHWGATCRSGKPDGATQPGMSGWGTCRAACLTQRRRDQDRAFARFFAKRNGHPRSPVSPLICNFCRC
jgi:hypothetical protein